MSSIWRSRWAAVGAAVAMSLGAGGVGFVHATTSSGEKPIYQPITPCRLADTRPLPDNVGGRTSPLGSEESYTLSGWGAVGNCTLPNGTAGLALNVTAFAPTQATYLTLHPTGVPVPTTSNLNPTPGQPPTPNAVNVDLSGAGEFDVFNKYGSVHVIIDVVGYYDDHNHDDRYYQKSEVDQEVAAHASTAAFASNDESVPIATGNTEVISVTVDTPGDAGTVLVNASGRLFNNLTPYSIRCSLTTGDAVDTDDFQGATVPTDTSVAYGATHAFDVGVASSLTVNLVCDRIGGTGGSMYDIWITATHVRG